MKKAANILFLISAIFAIIGAVGTLIGGIVLFVLSSPSYTQLIIDGIKAGKIHTDIPGTPEEIAYALQASFKIVGVVLVVLVAFIVVSAIFNFKARNSKSQAIFVVNLVFAVLTSNLISLIGSILALVEGDTVE